MKKEEFTCFNLRYPVKTHRILKKIGFRENTSVRQIIRSAIDQLLDRKNSRKSRVVARAVD